jgi:hypothetical protein
MSLGVIEAHFNTIGDAGLAESTINNKETNANAKPIIPAVSDLFIKTSFFREFESVNLIDLSALHLEVKLLSSLNTSA